MLAWIERRLIDLVITVLGVSTLVFVLLRLSGDPVVQMLPSNATEQARQDLRHSLGLDQPLPIQYLRFVGGVLQGDLGNSLQYKRPATQMVADTLPNTVSLTLVAMLISVLLAIPAGLLTAVYRNSWLARAVMVITLIAQSIPYFWLGVMLILFFSVQMRWLPTSGTGTPAHFVMPAMTLAIYSVARSTRLIRSSVLEALGQDYVRTAQAKGLRYSAVLFRHVIRNAAIPIVTLLALDFGVLLGGAVVTETIFAWPGVGRMIVDSIVLRDYPVVQAGVIYLAILFVLINALIDLSYSFLDPRIRGS
jgi:peptide/nickel transport system permease protein